MGRLTKHTPDNFGYAEYQLKHGVDEQSVISRLATYEDTGLGPEVCANYKAFEDEAISKGVTFKRIVELMEAERDGRLVELPCKVGDTVWFLINRFNVSNETCEPTIVELVVTEMRGNKHNPLWYIAERENGERASFHPTEIGKTVFLTRAEAEAALEGRE